MNEQAIRDAIETGERFDSFGTESRVEDVVRWKITDAMKLKGQSGADEGMMKATSRKVTEVIIRDYPTLTDKELDIILEAGVSGEFGKDTWVNGAAVLNWLRQYYKDTLRINVIDEHNDIAKKKRMPSASEIAERNREAYQNAYYNALEYYRENGTIFYVSKIVDGKEVDDVRAFHIPHWAALVYDEYHRNGVIKEPSEEDLFEADAYADAEIERIPSKPQFIEAHLEDWRKAHLLEIHFRQQIQ